MIKTSEKVKLDQLNQLNHQRGGGVGGRQQQSYSQWMWTKEKTFSEYQQVCGPRAGHQFTISSRCPSPKTRGKYFRLSKIGLHIDNLSEHGRRGKRASRQTNTAKKHAHNKNVWKSGKWWWQAPLLKWPWSSPERHHLHLHHHKHLDQWRPRLSHLNKQVHLCKTAECRFVCFSMFSPIYEKKFVQRFGSKWHSRKSHVNTHRH